MAFRKRNIAVGRAPTESVSPKAETPGLKPSSLTSQPVTSTGTPSLDSILGGHGGLALGSSLLIEESGTTDFSGALLRYFAAQGICHGHTLHLVGLDEAWTRSLPGVVDGKATDTTGNSKVDGEKMKIAWRYENLGQAAERALPNRGVPSHDKVPSSDVPFCHSFDLSKRLAIPQDASIQYLLSSATFDSVLRQLENSLKSSPQNSIHRLIISSILSPAIYPPSASKPENFLRFLHALRALLRQYSNTVIAMISIPLELYQRSSGLVRWAETFSDGVLEFQPFPHTMDSSSSLAESGGARSTEEQPQGLFTVHKLPITTERGEGGAGAENTIGEDLAFTVSRRKFVIKPFSLPPLESQEEPSGKLTGKDVEF